MLFEEGEYIFKFTCLLDVLLQVKDQASKGSLDLGGLLTEFELVVRDLFLRHVFGLEVGEVRAHAAL